MIFLAIEQESLSTLPPPLGIFFVMRDTSIEDLKNPAMWTSYYSFLFVFQSSPETF